jgi:hypothetical protein
MPDGETSSTNANPPGIDADLYDTHKELLADLWNLWGLHRRLNADLRKMDQERFSRISIVSCTHLAAVTAVDVSMSEEQFLNTCKANYRAAVQHAPRWG